MLLDEISVIDNCFIQPIKFIFWEVSKLTFKTSFLAYARVFVFVSMCLLRNICTYAVHAYELWLMAVKFN